MQHGNAAAWSVGIGANIAFSAMATVTRSHRQEATLGIKTTAVITALPLFGYNTTEQI